MYVPLTNVAQLGGHRPKMQKVTVLILDQGACLGYGPGPRVGHM